MSKKRTNNFKRFKEKMKSNYRECRMYKEESKILKIEDINIPNVSFEVDEDVKTCLGEPDYFVTNYGQLFHRCKNGTIKQCKVTYIQPNSKVGKKYGQVHINGRADYIHRVEGEVWCDGFDPIRRNEIHHKNHDSTDNRSVNLQWVNKIHHALLDRDVEIYIMHNRCNSDFQEVSDLVEVCNQMGFDIKYVGKKLKNKPDFHTNDLDMYEFDVGTEFPYIIALRRKRKVA